MPGMVNMTAANFTYVPNPLCVVFHNAPHLDSHLQLVQHPVYTVGHTPATEVGERAYFSSLLPFPIMLGVLGFIAVICLELGIQDYFTWLVPKLGPTQLDPEDETITAIALYTHQNEVNRKHWLTAFCVALGVAIFGTNFMWYGNALFEQGFAIFGSNLEQIGEMLFGISQNVAQLDNSLDSCYSLTQEAVSTTCAQAASVLPNLDNLYDQIRSYESEVRTIAIYTDSVHDEFITVAERKNIVLYIFYAISMIMLVAFIAVAFTKRHLYMRVTIYTAQAAMVLLIIFATFEFIVMMAMSDFCMEPTDSVVNSLAGMGIIQQMAKYYSTCHGLNPIHASLAESYRYRDIIGNQLLDLFDPAKTGAPCMSDRTVIRSFRALQSMYVVYENLASLMECDRIHDQWDRIFTLALCTNTMGGVLGLWIAGLITALGLFAVAITASVLMLYFDEFWELEKRMEEKVEHIREDQALLGSESGNSEVEADISSNKNMNL